MGSREHHGSRRDSTGDDRLRERYEELRLLRETQPEREAAACKQAMQKNRAATDKLVASLRENNSLPLSRARLRRVPQTAMRTLL